MRTVKISYGPMAKSLAEQLKNAGYIARDSSSLQHLQLDADAVVRLSIRRYLPRSQVLKLEARITRQIAQMLATVTFD
jgi:hypothetical protein